MSTRFSLIVVLALTITLSACQSIGPMFPSQEDSEAVQMARIAEQARDYQSAARQYLELAKSSYGTNRARFYLKAASAYWKNEQITEAQTTFSKIDKSNLTPTQLLEANILESQFSLNQSDADTALTLIEHYRLDELSSEQQSAILNTRIQAYALNENWLEKANSHIRLAETLAPSQQDENQQALWQALMKLTPQALDLFNPGMAPATDSGWFSLAYIIKSYQDTPEALAVALEDWQRNYPNHPADPSVYRTTLSSGTLLPQHLDNIAVLLPETGPYAKAAEAIKQGIFAAHFSSGSNSQLHFIDVQTDSITGLSNVGLAYQKALALNANIVIGPLDKESIQGIANGANLAVPVLALNRLTELQAHANLYQFGLAPEDDAIAVAKLAQEQGYKRAVVLFPDANWGERIASSFTEQWLMEGGTVLAQAKYNENENDFSKVISPLLGLESSKHRYQLLKQTLRQKAEFEARRRQDIDFIFLIARPLKARQLVPQLKFHRSGKMPILTTSHAFSGVENTQQDIDLNNTLLSDIPWVLAENKQDDPAYAALLQGNETNTNPLIRLYALGVDAYRLTSQLNQLSRSTTLSFPGATGILSINEFGQIERQLPTAKFINGKPTPISVQETNSIQ